MCFENTAKVAPSDVETYSPYIPLYKAEEKNSLKENKSSSLAK